MGGAPPLGCVALHYIVVISRSSALARLALEELDAPEPNRHPAQLMGGEVSWDHPRVQAAVHNDPPNAAVCRPHLIAACQELDKLGYRVPGLRCSCGQPLGFVAIAPFATGVQAVWSRRRLPPKERGGGWKDFARLDGAGHGWDTSSWEDALLSGSAGPRTAQRVRPVINSAGWRQQFICPHCRSNHVRLNVTLVRGILRAVAYERGEVVLTGRSSRVWAAPRSPASSPWQHHGAPISKYKSAGQRLPGFLGDGCRVQGKHSARAPKPAPKGTHTL